MNYRSNVGSIRALVVGNVVLFLAQPPVLVRRLIRMELSSVIGGFLVTAPLIVVIGKGPFSLPSSFGRKARRILPTSFFESTLNALQPGWAK